MIDYKQTPRDTFLRLLKPVEGFGDVGDVVIVRARRDYELVAENEAGKQHTFSAKFGASHLEIAPPETDDEAGNTEPAPPLTPEPAAPAESHATAVDVSPSEPAGVIFDGALSDLTPEAVAPPTQPAEPKAKPAAPSKRKARRSKRSK